MGAPSGAGGAARARSRVRSTTFRSAFSAPAWLAACVPLDNASRRPSSNPAAYDRSNVPVVAS